ncbi:MAG: type II toxin-antitoxin system VapC family toxin [Bacteroidota bacterium]|nr:type II toxin-antitoxin system VapC family toxin [Bacteroidota bacterium]MDP4234325.1 type II toxin-antitoxin system VapC family toxin [Bacteroidota bacterium]MDP4243259.1 type II toxin-antitoxin system VapC family toxin [Bacteroidota bacterium]MDP4288034.1 type II toxin-antitoxin system VapC family toxin [Bacteroidota bacterium]
MNLLLDTQSFLWYVMGDARLPQIARSYIEDPSNPYQISVASLWELAIKDGSGKLRLDVSFHELVDQYVLGSGLTILPISVDHLLELRRLPHHHRDPFDRIIIAQSIVEELTVITTDSQFEKYPIRIAR